MTASIGSEPEEPESKRDRFGWVARRPRRAFWITLGVGFLIGVGIGAAAANRQSEVDRQTQRAEAAEQRLADTEGERDARQIELNDVKDELNTTQARVKVLSAKGELPDLTDEDIDDALLDDRVVAYSWRIKTIRQVSDRDPGTVIAQRPTEGTTLRSGRSITLTVAKKAPPKPRQWVTIKTLSGGASTKTDEFTIPNGVKARLSYSMPEDSNNAIELYQSPDEYVDLLLNEIGPQAGTSRLYRPGTYYLDVTGAYTIDVQVFKRPK